MNSNNFKLASYFDKYDYLERLVKTYKPYSSLEIKNSKKKKEFIKDVKSSNNIQNNKYIIKLYRYNVLKYYCEELKKLDEIYYCTKYNISIEEELKNYKMNTSLFKFLLNHDNKLLQLGYDDKRKNKQYIRDEFDFFKINPLNICLRHDKKYYSREIIYWIKKFSQHHRFEMLYENDYLNITKSRYNPYNVNLYLVRNNFHIPSLSYLICLIYLSILLKKDIKEIINFDEIKDFYYVFINKNEEDIIEIKYACSVYRMIDNIYKEFVFCYNEPKHLYSDIDNYFYIVKEFLKSFEYKSICYINFNIYKEKFDKFFKYLGEFNNYNLIDEITKIN